MIEIVIRDSRLIKGAAMQVHEDLIEDNPDKVIEVLQDYVARMVGDMLKERNAE